MSGSAVAIALFKQHHQEYQQQQQQRHQQLTSRLYNSLSARVGEPGSGSHPVGSGNHNNNNNNNNNTINTNDGATGSSSSNLSFNNHPLNNNLLSKHSNTNNHVGGGVNLTVGANQSTASPGNSGGGYLLPCPLCETPLEPRVFRHHLDRHYPRDSPICPVIQCGRRFAHPNSVRNHMRLKHTMQWAKMKAMRSSGGPYVGMKGDGPDRFMIP
jgi:hypothetical protein